MQRRTFIQAGLGSLLAGYAVLLEPLALWKAGAQDTTARAALVAALRPRLLTDSFSAMRAAIDGSAEVRAFYEIARADADSIVGRPVSTYAIPDGLRLLETSREVLRRTYSLSIAFVVENDARYAERLWQELDAVCGFPDWNHSRHFLDTAEMTHAVAVGYDWLWDYWSPDRRSRLAAAIRTMGLEPGQRAHASGEWWTTATNNWNVVCNSGLVLGALAVHEDDPAFADALIDTCLAAIAPGVAEYAPDGAYPEGVGYWMYATKYLVALVASLQSSTGQTRGLDDAAGLSTTGRFPIALVGPTGEAFNYYDANTSAARPPEMFWLAGRYADNVLAWWGTLGATTISWQQAPVSLLWWNPDAVRGPIESGLALDAGFSGSELATARSGWENPQATFVAIKGGDNSESHGDLDLGTFVFDALGARWATELGPDDYNLPGYFEAESGGRRWLYYRKRTEGQNTLVVAPSADAGQTVDAVGTVQSQDSGVHRSSAILELSRAHPQLTSWRRGAMLFTARQQLLVQDELTLASPADAWWFMHTIADVEITADGRSAILRRGGRTVRARISSPDGAQFVDADARALWTSPEPSGQLAMGGIHKLAIRLRAVSDAVIAVQFTPEYEGIALRPLKEVRALSEWTSDREDAAQLEAILIDGTPIAAFSPSSTFYSVRAPDASVPVIKARAASASAVVRVQKPSKLPGIAVLTVAQPRVPRGEYLVLVQPPLDAPADFYAPIIASADDGNTPDRAIDGDSLTRWSAEGDAQWIALDLGADGPVTEVDIAWFSGHVRATSFDVELAREGATAWTRVYSGSSSGTTSELERYQFAQAQARFVRIIGHGNTVNGWNSISEISIPGRVLPSVTPRRRLASVAASVGASVQLGATSHVGVTGMMSDGTPADLTGASFEFYSSDPSVLEVGAEGTMRALKEGTVTFAAVVTDAARRLVFDRHQVAVVDRSLVVVPVAGDTYVNDGTKATTNYVGLQEMLVKNSPPIGSGFNRRALLRFTVPELDGPVSAVTLSLSAAIIDSAGGSFDLQVHEVADFDPTQVTWNTQPALGAHLGAVTVTTTQQWVTADISTLAATAVAGQTISLALVQVPSGTVAGLTTRVASAESAAPPRLSLRVEL